MSKQDDLLRMIEQIYEAAADPGWGNLISDLAPLFHSNCALLAVRAKPPSTEARLLSRTSNFSGWAFSSWAEYYHKKDEWFVRTIKRGVPTVVTSQEIIDDASFARTEFCNDWCEKLDIFQMVAATCQVSDSLIGEIGFARPRWMDRFEEQDRETIKHLLPHLQRALQLHYRLSVAEQKSALMLGCFERLAVAVMVVDRESRVLFANDIAERVLSRSAGITLSRGALRPQDPRQGPRLARLVAMAARTSSGHGANAGGIVTLPRPMGAPLSLLVSPFRVATAGFGPQRPAAVIIFSDPDAKASSSEEVLAQTYGLTKAEASLLAALVEGQSPNEYASKRGLSVHTPKKHLQRIFQKTGYRRQIDLVRAIIANPALTREGK